MLIDSIPSLSLCQENQIEQWFCLAWSFVWSAIDRIGSILYLCFGLTLAYLVLGTLLHFVLVSLRATASDRVPEGLHQVWPSQSQTEGVRPIIDFVAIHGLDTSAPKTWVAYKNGHDPSGGLTNWLEDENMLPSRFPQSRIFTYDWNATTTNDAAEDTLLGHAKCLIRGLEDRDFNDTPIVFIASCFGGLLLAKAITHASLLHNDGYDLIKRVRGMLFLGTPFGGSDTAEAARIRVRLAGAMRGGSSGSLIRYLTDPKNNLHETVMNFAQLAKTFNIPLVCFYETKPSLVLSGLLPSWLISLIPERLKPWIPFGKERILVPSDSATIHTFPSFPVHVKHTLLNKFFSSDDRRFKEICTQLQCLKATGTENLSRALQQFYSRLNRLDIDTLSGEKLDMGRCFINLGIVDYIHNSEQKRDEDLNDIQKLSSVTFGSSLYPENVPKEKQLRLRELFAVRPHISKIQPHRIFIWGRAGVGKSTLCKKIVHDFIFEGMWNDNFDCVFWLPLRRLKLIQSYPQNLGELIRQQYFHDQYGREFSVENLQRILEFQSDRLLFVLDGLDEVYHTLDSESSLRRILEELKSQPNVIITSRPHTMRGVLGKFDLELETIGFSPKQIDEYLQRQEMPATALSNLRNFVKNNARVRTLACIPVQLEAICLAWETKRFQDGRTTMSSLYWAILGRLCEKDIPKLGRKNSVGETTTQQQLEGYSTIDILSMVTRECNLLGRLAFDGLRKEIVEFDMVQISRANANELITPDSVLLHMSFLRSSDSSTNPRHRTYHFLHLTYQEFFAAKYFVDQWTIFITRVSAAEIDPSDLIRREKYNPRYNIFWRFVVGLLRINASSLLADFMDIFDGEPLDLQGPMHQEITIQFLSEVFARDELEPTLQSRIKSLEERYTEWTKFEAKFKSLPQLMLEPACPDGVFKSWLQGDDDQKIHAMSALCQRSNLPLELLNLVKEQLNPSEKGVYEAAVRVLVHYYIQTSEVNLLALVRHCDSKEVALSALQGYHNLEESILTGLAQLFQGEDLAVRRSIARVLCVQDVLPVTIIKHVLLNADFNLQSLIVEHLFKRDVPDSIFDLLIRLLIQMLGHDGYQYGQATDKLFVYPYATSVSVFERLVQLLQAENPKLHNTAAQILRETHGAPALAVDCLIPILKHNNSELQLTAIHTLRHQTDLPTQIVNILISLLQDENLDVRASAARALQIQTDLHTVAVEQILHILQQGDCIAKRSAARALSGQTKLSEPVRTILFTLLEEEDEDEHVIVSATAALMAQVELSEDSLTRLISIFERQSHLVQDKVLINLNSQYLSKAMIEILICMLKHEDTMIRSHSAYHLSMQHELSASALEALVLCLQDTSLDVIINAQCAFRTSANLTGSVIRMLVALFQHGELRVSAAAIFILVNNQGFCPLALNLDSSTFEKVLKQEIRQSFTYPDMTCWAIDDRLYSNRSRKLQSEGQEIEEPAEFRLRLSAARKAIGVPGFV